MFDCSPAGRRKFIYGGGSNHVRIPINEVQFWDENGNKLPEAWTLLTNALDWCHKHRLRAIVDLHIIRSHNFNAGFNGTHNTLFEDPAAQDALINLWYQLSDVLKGYPNSEVAYEFLNEPVAEEHEQWNQLIAKVHKAIREREPKRTLIIGSNMWQSVGTMKYLKVPEGDRNIILSFHEIKAQEAPVFRRGSSQHYGFDETICSCVKGAKPPMNIRIGISYRFGKR